jgi:hypothetical protein
VKALRLPRTFAAPRPLRTAPQHFDVVAFQSNDAAIAARAADVFDGAAKRHSGEGFTGHLCAAHLGIARKALGAASALPARAPAEPT